MVEFRVLGQLQVWSGDQRLRLRGARQERLLAGLLLRVDRTVPVDRLAGLVWDGAPPPTGYRLVQNLTADLRRSLVAAGAPAGVLATERSGYRLSAGESELDAKRFLALVRAAETEADPAGAVARLRAALGLWRGAAFDGLGGVIEADAATWNERRLTAWERCLELELALGRHAELAAELVALTAAHPFREKLTMLAMLALHRCGRRPEALAAYRALRDRLAEELGIDPGDEVADLHAEILRGTAAVRAVAVRPAQLPADVPTFVGRGPELAALDSAPGVVVVTGTAGVGKTAFAVHWAHKSAYRFPDGQLYLNLRGFAPGQPPVAPAEALAGFLDALGVDRLPAEVDARTALFRSLIRDRRLLIVLDNAADAEQVRPLLPGSPGHQVVITSRNTLAGLVAVDGAHPVTLAQLSTEDALALLRRRLGDARVAAEPAAAAEIVRRCARLPLALVVVAARAAAHPAFSLSALAVELGGLDALGGDDPASDVRSVLSWSYRTLSVPAARLFRRLGLHAGTEIGVAAAASLAGEPVARTLGELAGAHLIAERAPGRYVLHDLLRAYAAELALAHDPPADRRSALHRVLDHYLHTGAAASLLMHPERDPIDLPSAPVAGAAPSSADEARAWFAAERDSLLAAVRQSAEAGLDGHTWRLAWVLAPVLDRGGHWRDWIEVQSAALAAAERLGDAAGEADAHRHLASAHARLGRLDLAEEHYERALAGYRILGDRTGEANMHINLSWVGEQRGRYGDALARARQALDLFTACALPFGQALATNAVGWYLALMGAYPEALVHCRRALDLYATMDQPTGAADTWGSLGFVHHRLGRFDEAERCYRTALDLYRVRGDRYGEATVLDNLADTQLALARPEAALAGRELALRILDDLNHPDATTLRTKLSTSYPQISILK